MRVLQINTEPGWRGGERQTLYTASGLAKLGHEAVILCRAGHNLAQRARDAGLPTIEAASTLHALRLLATRGSGFDVLHAQTAKAQSLAAMAKPLHRRPIVYTRRVDFRQSGLPTRLKYARCDAVVAISQAIARYIQADIGRPVMAVIPSAVAEAPQTLSADELRARYAAPGKHLLGTVAALVPHKDPLTMVRAIAALRDLRGGDFVFVHCGKGPLRPRVETEIHALGLTGTYVLAGFCEHAADHVRAFDVFAMSSVEEGLGSTVLDAFLYATPVAVTDAGGLPELASDGRGLISPKGDAAALAASINTLLNDDALRTRITATASAYVRAEHSVEGMCEKYVGVYEKIPGGGEPLL